MSMKLFEWLFGRKKQPREYESKEEYKETSEIAEKATAITAEQVTEQVEPTKVEEAKPDPETTEEQPELVASSNLEPSDACTLGNLIYEKKYQEAIDLGTKLLETKPDDCGIHINLMEAYFKLRHIQDYWAKSSYHAKQAIINGHTTGYAHERLAKNLDSAKLYHKSLQLYNLILDNKDFHFSASGCGKSIDWEKRRANVLARMNKASDKDTDILFTPEEIAKIIRTIKDEELQEKKRELMWNAIERAWERGDSETYDKLLKRYHQLY